MVGALVSLLCRENISAQTLWDGGWLLGQLLPYSEAEFNRKHLKMLNVCCFQHVFIFLFDTVSIPLFISSLFTSFLRLAGFV